MSYIGFGFGKASVTGTVPPLGMARNVISTIPGLACLADFAPAVSLTELVASATLAVRANLVSLVDNANSILLSDWALDEQVEIPSIVVLAELASGVALQDSSTEILLDVTSPVEVTELTSGVEVTDAAPSVTIVEIVEEKCP